MSKTLRIRGHRFATATLIAATALSCATDPISIQFDRKEDFSKLHRFAWYPNVSPAQADERRRFPEQFAATERAAERHLTEKGYEKVSRGEADFLVSFQMSLERRLDTRTVNEIYARSGSEWEVNRVVTREETFEYQKGSIVIDVLDARLRRLVWRGSASGTFEVDEVPTPDRLERRTSEILAKFPPPPGD